MMHTKACVLNFEHYEKERAEWLACWGKTYCHACGGYGVINDTFDPSPSHVSLGPGYMDASDPCTCTEPQDDKTPHCPRCGQYWPYRMQDGEMICTTTEQKLPCPFCDWNWGENLDDALPAEPICFCDEGPDTEDLGASLWVDEMPELLSDWRERHG